MEQLSQLHDLYLSCSDLADSSAAIKGRAVKLFMEWFGDMVIGDISYCHAEDFRNRLAKGRSKTSANIYIKNFAPFFTWAVKRGYIKLNPFSEISLFTVTEITRPPYSPQQIERIIKVADTRWKVIVLLALCSLRRAEILNLTTRDFDFDNQYVNITPKTTTQQTWQWDIKNHQQAIVPMPETIELPTMAVNLHNFIYDLIAELPEGQPYVIVKPSYYRRLMNQSKISFEKRNCPWGNFNRDFTNLLRRASVDQKRFHELRATFATIMAKYHSLPKVQKLMRHSSPQTTVKYIRNDEQKLIASTVKVMKKCYATNVP